MAGTVSDVPRPATPGGPLPPAVAVVVPTFNEAPNIATLVARLEQVLAGRPWEVVFVDDDSPDGTSAEVQALAREKPHVRGLLRLGRRER